MKHYLSPGQEGLSFLRQRQPVRRLCCGLQQLKLPLVRKHVLILHQEAIDAQVREQIDQLRRRNTHEYTIKLYTPQRTAVLLPCEGILFLGGHLSNPGEPVSFLWATADSSLCLAVAMNRVAY